MAISRIQAKHNGRRSTKAFALSAVLSIVAVGLFAVNASAISGARLDTSFDSDGMLITSFGGYDFAYAVAIQADGKIVVAGASDVNGNDDFALSRYNTDGTLDTSFDSDGKLTTNFAGSDNANSVAIQTDGKIVVAGWSGIQSRDFALARYNTDGSLDTSFDTDGKLTTNLGGRDVGESVAIQADGKIVVAGWSEVSPVVDFAVARYNTDGSLDTSFDTDGKLTTNFGENGNWGRSAAIQANGKIVVAGLSYVNNVAEFGLARYNTNGSLDTSFDTDGKLTTNFGSDTFGYSVAVQLDGKIVVAGDNNAGSSYQFALARYNTDGTLDTSFDSDGKLMTSVGDNSLSDGVSAAIQSDGKIVVAGLSKANGVTDFGLARYNTDGTLDTSFDTDGKLTINFGGDDEAAFSVAIQPDGKIVAAGYSSEDTYSFAIARYDVTAVTPISQIGADIDGEAAGNQSGNSVAMSADGTRIAIGASYNGGNGIDAGHVRVYSWNGTAWIQTGIDIDGEAAGDGLGTSVAMSADGTRIAIGAPRNDGNGIDAGHVRVYSWSGTAWTQTGADIDGEAAGDLSGYSVAMSADGNRLAIGAPHNSAFTGHVRMYSWSSTAWTQTGTDIDGEAAGDWSGYSVAMSADGNRLASSALFNDGNGSDAGHVRMYSWSGTAWTQTGTDIDGEAAVDYSGHSVAMSADGTRIAIGAPFNDGNGSYAGHVRMYSWSGTAWTQIGADIDGEAAVDYSGISVAMSADGRRFANGATSNDGNGADAGHVRVYAVQNSPDAPIVSSVTAGDSSLTVSFTPGNDGGSPITNYKYSIDGTNYIALNPATTTSPFTISGLTNGTTYSVTIKAVNTIGDSVASNAITGTPVAAAGSTPTTTPTTISQIGADIDGEAAGDNSGTSIAMSADGTRIAIGAPFNDGNGSYAGHVRMYSWSGTAWTQIGADIDGEAAVDYSGISVAMSSDGTRIAIGAPFNDGNGSYAGHVRVYSWNGTGWTQTGADIDGEAAGDQSGYSVAMSADGTRLAIGAPSNDGNGSDAGHVRMYSWSGTAWTQIGADIDGEAAVDYSGISVAMSADGTRIAIGAPHNGGNGSDAGHVRMYSWNGTAWTQTGTDIDGEATGDWSGYSVAMSADGTRIASSALFNDGNFSDAGHVRVYGVQVSPTAPTITSVTVADGSLTVTFTLGNDGGSPITNYKYSIDGSNYIALNPATTTSPFTIGGLTNGTTYSVTIKAVNTIGDSVASNAITGTPVAVPATPTAPNNAPTPTTADTTSTVVPTPALVGTGSLPETGINPSILVIISALFVLSGMTLIRRRRVFSN